MDGQMGVWGAGGVYGEGIGGVLWKWVGNGGWADGWVGVYGGGRANGGWRSGGADGGLRVMDGQNGVCRDGQENGGGWMDSLGGKKIGRGHV